MGKDLVPIPSLERVSEECERTFHCISNLQKTVCDVAAEDIGLEESVILK